MSRLVLDIYDDRGQLMVQRGRGVQMRKLASEAGNPELCPDDLFALTIGVPGTTGYMRKFACNDLANTVLSTFYFLETSARLPSSMRKTAAQRLIRACGWYGLTPPAELKKIADVSGTDLAPLTSIPKSEDRRHRELELGLKAVKTTPESQRKQAQERPMEKEARFADPVGRKYPLDSVSDVMAANEYMDKYAAEIEPRRRRTMAIEIYKRAGELRLPVSRSVRDLAIVKVASMEVIRGHLEARKQYCGPGSDGYAMYSTLQEKLAGLRPAVIAETIAMLDRDYGLEPEWGHYVPDPWSTVFTKRAETNASTYSYDAGTKRVSGADLTRLAKMGLKQVSDRFGQEFAREFSKDPVGFFDHLPLDEKKVLINLAHDSFAPPFAPALAAGPRA